MTTRQSSNLARRNYLLKSQVPFHLAGSGSSDNSLKVEEVMVNEIRAQELRILVIDDDEDFRKSFCFKLKRKYKAQVDAVSSGEAGIRMLSDGNSYDFIFTDIMMPGMTGIEAYRKLREIDGTIPIVVMSAYSDSEEWKKALQLNVPLLHKPISEDQLIKILGN